MLDPANLLIPRSALAARRWSCPSRPALRRRRGQFQGHQLHRAAAGAREDGQSGPGPWTYAGDGAAALPFEGDLDFQLFREVAPLTVGFIAGFAQAGYYDGLTFHRVIEDFVAQGGDPAGTGAGFVDTDNDGMRDADEPFLGLPFDFENELHPGLIFSGRGQLAMANRGLNRGSRPLGQLDPRILLAISRPRTARSLSPEQLRADASESGRANLDFKHTISPAIAVDLLRSRAFTDASDDKPTVDEDCERMPAGEATFSRDRRKETEITVIATDRLAPSALIFRALWMTR